MSYVELFAGIFKFLNWIFGPSHGKQVKKVVAIYDAMAKILDETSVQRILILKIHNGGAIIKSSGEIYVSVLYEDYDIPFHAIKATYQKVEVDREYAKMILELIQKKKINYKVEDMPKSYLKDTYISSGVESAILHYIGQDKRTIYFTSCVTSEKGDWMSDPRQYVPLETYLNIIKQNIK